jgi:hypothetical protein
MAAMMRERGERESSSLKEHETVLINRTKWFCSSDFKKTGSGIINNNNDFTKHQYKK